MAPRLSHERWLTEAADHLLKMGIDAGFDMVPQLTRDADDTIQWAQFIQIMKDLYKHDDQVEVRSNYMIFKAGEHPTLPFEGHKFLRFSSKISGSIAASSGVERYIQTVTRSARIAFGSRVQPWNEGRDDHGHYDWARVHESVRSYEQCDDNDAQLALDSVSLRSAQSEEVGTSLYEVKIIPGSGRGLVARIDIAKGSRILVETPLLIVQSESPHTLEGKLAVKLKGLPKSKQRQFLALHNNFPGRHPFSGTARTNALPCGSGSSLGGIYPTICLINHSCLPNSHNNWNDELGHETIHAVRYIPSGSEITISYCQEGNRQARQTHLKQAFGFECGCITCLLPATELSESDRRRDKILTLDTAIGDPFRMKSRPTSGLRDCFSLIQTLEQEYVDSTGALHARLYYDAFQISVAHGDQARAAIFAKHAYDARVICEGDDSPLTRTTKGLMEDPTSHSTFGAFSMKWRSTVGHHAKDLDEESFVNWLWRLE